MIFARVSTAAVLVKGDVLLLEKDSELVFPKCF